MKRKNNRKKEQSKQLKTIDKSTVCKENENYNNENERLIDLNIIIDRFLKEAMENTLLNDFEAGDIRFLLNDYLAEHSDNEIVEYYNSDETQTTDDL
ncbi:MAG: hypothetical protein HZB41_02980 [Ignavibacteriae bacterium]|nr:hypothetical protein [Ignavibacteriota bacterium]